MLPHDTALFRRRSPVTALVGMSRTTHVEENSNVVAAAPAGLEQLSKLFQRGETA